MVVGVTHTSTSLAKYCYNINYVAEQMLLH
jgi:hypothetical protein